MAITNPPTKRKKLSGLSGYLYIDDADSWTVNNTPVFKWDSTTCYTPPTNGNYAMDDSTTIHVTDGKIVA